MLEILSMPAVALLCAGVVLAQVEPAPAAKSPNEAVATALARAKSHNKRALVVFEEPGKERSTALAQAMQSDRTLARTLRYEFEVVRVDAAQAAGLATAHAFPAGAAKPPALLVLDAEGKVLGRLGAADLFAGEEVQAARIHAELLAVKAAPLDAEKVLAGGLADAKESDRRVFVRFDAPW